MQVRHPPGRRLALELWHRVEPEVLEGGLHVLVVDVAVAGVEKEVGEFRGVEVRLLEDERHSEEVAVERDGARGVAAHHGHVVGAGQVEWAVRRGWAHLVVRRVLHAGRTARRRK